MSSVSRISKANRRAIVRVVTCVVATVAIMTAAGVLGTHAGNNGRADSLRKWGSPLVGTTSNAGEIQPSNFGPYRQVTVTFKGAYEEEPQHKSVFLLLSDIKPTVQVWQQVSTGRVGVASEGTKSRGTITFRPNPFYDGGTVSKGTITLGLFICLGIWIAVVIAPLLHYMNTGENRY